MLDVSPEVKVQLIVGLGNPGRDYEGTRHNIGFAVVEEIARRHGISFSFEKKWNADLAKITGDSFNLVLMKPRTFMNLSGAAAASYARFFHLTAQQTLVIADDVALPLGSLRLRRSGSAGGQRGLESVLTHFGTEEVPRLRVGIGSLDEKDSEKKIAAEMSLSNYVLSRFHDQEHELVQQIIQRAADAVEALQRESLDSVMNLYNP